MLLGALKLPVCVVPTAASCCFEGGRDTAPELLGDILDEDGTLASPAARIVVAEPAGGYSMVEEEEEEGFTAPAGAPA